MGLWRVSLGGGGRLYVVEVGGGVPRGQVGGVHWVTLGEVVLGGVLWVLGKPCTGGVGRGGAVHVCPGV